MAQQRGWPRNLCQEAFVGSAREPDGPTPVSPVGPLPPWRPQAGTRDRGVERLGSSEVGGSVAAAGGSPARYRDSLRGSES